MPETLGVLGVGYRVPGPVSSSWAPHVVSWYIAARIELLANKGKLHDAIRRAVPVNKGPAAKRRTCGEQDVPWAIVSTNSDRRTGTSQSVSGSGSGTDWL